MSNKVYLGDSVYADFDGWHIVLTTENGFGPTNEIFLEPEVMQTLAIYAESIYEENRKDDRDKDRSDG